MNDYTDTVDQADNGHRSTEQPRRQRRARAALPSLDDRHTRRQVASQLAIRVEALHAGDGLGQGAEQMANDDLAELLADVIAELRV